MRLHLGGHLNWYDPQKRSWQELHPPESTSLVELLGELRVPIGEVALTVVNGRVVELEEACVSDGDRVELYPPIGGGNPHLDPSPANRGWSRDNHQPPGILASLQKAAHPAGGKDWKS
jgi:sulfur carrier protein ThiS